MKRIFSVIFMLLSATASSASEVQTASFYECYDISAVSSAQGPAFRDFNTPIDPKEKKMIRNLICTLGNKPLGKIWKEQSSLRRIANKLSHIHPLRFLEYVFTEEEITMALANIIDRQYVWPHFTSIVFTSLDEESQRQNLLLEHVQLLAKTLRIDPNLIFPALQQQQWREFLLLLLQHSKR